MAQFGSTTYAWAQPTESLHNEQWGPDSSRATAVIKIHLPPGGSAPAGQAGLRRQAIKDLLEYPTLTTTNGITYIQRHLPLACGQPFTPSDPTDNVDEGFWATRFAGGEGKGPAGQSFYHPADAQAGPLPVYQYYQYTLEFADRTYYLLPDADVLAPGPLSPPVLNAVEISDFPGIFQPPTQWFFVITALTGDGETTKSNELGVRIAAPFSAVYVNWQPVAGAIGYNVYGSFLGPGLESLVMIFGIQGEPDGAGNLATILFSPFGAGTGGPPTVNTSTGPFWHSTLGVGRPDEGYWLAAGNGRIGGRYVTRLDEPGGYGQTIPRGFLQYQSGGIITEGLMKVVPVTTRKLTWHMVPRNAVPIEAIIAQQGTVNNAPFDGWPTGTLLFDSVEPRRYRDPLLNRCIDLTYTMIGKPNINRFGQALGHNSALKFIPAQPPNPAFVDYDYVWSDKNGQGNPPYRSSNFANLFRPPQS
ncbi:MAG TPA: hypothetical protein VMS17_17805 [Gemmataceae bacterium]|nr:hypothetical protein [Gemmataceae bacterium]